MLPLLLRRCALVLAFGLTACAGTAEDEVVTVPIPTFGRVWIDPLPLTVVYAFAPGIDGTRPVQARGAGERPVLIDVGGASRVAIERVIGAGFDGATEGLHGAEGCAGACAGIIRIALVGLTDVSVTYALAFVDPDGTTREVWEVRGVEISTVTRPERLKAAVRHAAAQIARGLAGQPALMAWTARRVVDGEG
jgi:hypothetical protein